MSAIVFAVIAAGSFGLSDFLGGIATRRVPAGAVMRLTFPLSAIGVTALAVFGGGSPTPPSLLLGASSGFVLVGATAMLYRALALGPMSVLSPLSALLTTAIPCVIGAALGERLGPLALVGVATACLAVLLVSARGSGGVERIVASAVLLTLGSGVAFALSYALLFRTSGDSAGLWPLAAARIAATATVLASARRGELRSVRRPAAAIAALDVIGNVALVAAFADGSFAGTSVLVSLFPVATIAAAVLVLRESLRLQQVAGIVAAIAAVGLIASG